MNKRIMAKFVPQAWINDHAYDIDGTVEFDCTKQIVQIGKETAMKLKDDEYDSDNLTPPEIRDKHNGPFRVEIESAICEFFGK